MNVIKAIYDFLVGDIIILIGVIITVIVLALINSVPALASLRVASGVLLIIAVLGTLIATLSRETKAQK
ncbi:MAG TPA: hypothetical protein VFU49_17575 [Ktedonobacteraceae bacterium]|nr:hypothetical protein [Ktedonobacteraceae bacterium]